jgi:hypothetical protein
VRQTLMFWCQEKVTNGKRDRDQQRNRPRRLRSSPCALLHQLELPRPPSFVEPRLKRPVEAQEDVPAFAGNGLHPVVLMATRSLRAESIAEELEQAEHDIATRRCRS